MLHVRLISDIHLEYTPYVVSLNNEDILIIAGDISPVFEDSIKLITDYLKINLSVFIILILGNHDYYGNALENTIYKWREFTHDRFHFLHDNYVELYGYYFYGTTMWTNVDGKYIHDVSIQKYELSDYIEITGFSVKRCNELHHRSKTILKHFLNTRTIEENIVVITHHLPSYRSINAKYMDNILNSCYASSDLDHLMSNKNIKYWMHGHTHQSNNYWDELTNTRVICNPRGRCDIETNVCENKNFNDNLIIKLL